MLIWICALHCEAKPVIDHYRLKKDQTRHGFDLYLGDDVACVVSGIGQTNMAAACGWSAALLAQHPRCWINLGVAGHRSYGVGEGVLVNKISREGDTRPIYPVPLQRSRFTQAPIVTQQGERHDYHADALYDMEAWAFASALSHFDSHECIQCFKVVSDNARSAPTRDKATISRLIAKHIGDFADYARQLHRTIAGESPPADNEHQLLRFSALAHFSVSQKVQLGKLLPGLQGAGVPLEELYQQARTLPDARSILRLLSDKLHQESVRL